MCPATKLLLADVYTASIWEFAQDMYYKQPKKDEYGYHLGTVNVIPNHSQKRLGTEKMGTANP